MKDDKGFQQLGDLFASRKTVKAPAYEWQDLALRVIRELGIPGFKKGSVFKVCRDLPKETIERNLNETKELCKSGEKWKYFFKLVENKNPQEIRDLYPADDPRPPTQTEHC